VASVCSAQTVSMRNPVFHHLLHSSFTSRDSRRRNCQPCNPIKNRRGGRLIPSGLIAESRIPGSHIFGRNSGPSWGAIREPRKLSPNDACHCGNAPRNILMHEQRRRPSGSRICNSAKIMAFKEGTNGTRTPEKTK